MAEKNENFVVSRVFDAPRDVMFELWTNPKHLQKWFSPKGSSVKYVREDIRPGGSAHYCVTTADGVKMYGKAIYREIDRPTRIVYVQHFSNEKEEVTVHPLASDWPRHMLTTIVFEEQNSRTKITLTWAPVDPTAAELAIFNKAREGMSQGWGGTFENLDAYLKEIL